MQDCEKPHENNLSLNNVFQLRNFLRKEYGIDLNAIEV
jgi:hypothetical protein